MKKLITRFLSGFIFFGFEELRPKLTRSLQTVSETPVQLQLAQLDFAQLDFAQFDFAQLDFTQLDTLPNLIFH